MGAFRGAGSREPPRAPIGGPATRAAGPSRISLFESPSRWHTTASGTYSLATLSTRICWCSAAESAPTITEQTQSTADGAEKPCVPHPSASISRSRLALGTPEPLETREPETGRRGPTYNRVPGLFRHYSASYLRSKKLSSIRKTHPYRRIRQCGRCDFPHFRTQNRHACHSNRHVPSAPR